MPYLQLKPIKKELVKNTQIFLNSFSIWSRPDLVPTEEQIEYMLESEFTESELYLNEYD